MKRSCNNVFGPSSYDDQLEACASIVYTDKIGHECTTEYSLKGDTTVHSVVQYYRQSVSYNKENTDLILQAEDNSKSILLSEHLDSTIRDLGIDMRLKYKILSLPQQQDDQQHQLQDKNKMQLYVNDTVEDDLLLGASASPTTGELPTNNGDVPNLPISENDNNDHSHCTRCRINETNNIVNNDDDNVENDQVATCSNDTTNYVGLVNQAMTCYLNSLVQALFMTPEFRNAIYNWEFDGQNETRSIPYQLQKLFLNLQTSPRSAVETTDLTTSFGWQGSEAWHQHDIQELCRVMFDALERKFKDTKQANLINDLYEGKMLDYVKCLECGTEKSREDTFLDIPLPVRPFGSNVAYNSVEEALRAFVQPETLDGNNQYHCEKCNKKCDAHKGLKFIKFPYLLTLHLKRFDFDYSTMHRIKLNDKVVFPEKLNLNSFVPNNNSNTNNNNSNNNNNNNNNSTNTKTENETIEERDIVIKCDDCSTTDSGSALDDESCQGTDLSSAINDHDNCEDSDEGIDVSSGNTHHENDAKGPYNYELFSIMIHSGSASGGHYYAYIKDLDRNIWLCFNDQTVTRITEDDIRKTYGGGPQKGYYSGVYTSSTNAYMLMYRQIDKERNCKTMKIDEFPLHIQNLLQDMRKKEKLDKINKEKQNNSTKLTVNCYHPITGELSDIRMTMLMDSRLDDAIATAHRRFKLDGLVAIEDCRLVVFNKKHQCIDSSFESDDLKFCDIMNKYKIFYSEWLLEIKEPGTKFKSYKQGGINMRVYHVNVETEDVREPVFVRVDVDDTVKMLKDKISVLLGVDSNNLKVIMERYCHDPQYLDDDNAILQFDNVVSEFKLYVSSTFDEDPDWKFEESKMKKIIEKFEHIIHIDVLLPDTDPITLESLGMPLSEMGVNYDKLEPERTNSPSLRISPQPGNTADNFGDQSNSEDSISSDSDRTLVGDAPGENQLIFSSSSNSPADQHMTSPTDPAEDVYNYDVLGNPAEEMNWEGIPNNNLIKQQSRNYFKVTSIRECRKGNESTGLRLCKIFIEKRMTLEMFKRHLEAIIKIPKEYFKVYKNSPTPDEEWTALSDTFKLIRDGQTLTIKLGRALSRNEYNCKVYLLKLDNSEPTQFLFEHIINLQQTVGQAKKEILLKVKKQHMLDIPYYKSRLREKYFKKPRKVYLDDQLFSDLIVTANNFEVFLQELNEPEKVTHSTKLVLFVRHWCPSTMTLEPFQEIVMDTTSVAELKQKIAEISNIPIENVEFAFVRNTFPFDMNLLDIHSELYWSPNVDYLEQWPVQADYGAAFFYRDNREKLKELTSEEKKEISIKENTRLGRVASRTGTALEKSLRIYTDNWPSETDDNCID